MKLFIRTFVILFIIFSACKKNADEPQTSGWSEEDQNYYHSVINLQNTAAENYATWSQTMDSIDAVSQLQQFFQGDSSVTLATMSSQGISVQYSNGMRGGILLNPEDQFGDDTSAFVMSPEISLSGSNAKSIPNNKKAVFLNAHYWQRMQFANPLIAKYDLSFPKVGFTFQDKFKDMEVTVDRFTQLSGYGFIHIYSHGYAWPKKTAISEIYLMTGEKENENTTKKYWDEIKNGDILIHTAKAPDQTISNVYWISKKFMVSNNDFSKDTVLFYGGFCFSFLGTWTEIINSFAQGSYFGFSWRVNTAWNCSLAEELLGSLSDTSVKPPITTEQWMTNPNPVKKKWDNTDNKYCDLLYTGDATLTLWRDSIEIETTPVTDITQTSARSGGNITSDGGDPVTARGVCWSYEPNPTTDDTWTYNGQGTGVFTSNMTGLTPDTLYYVRAYAINSTGTYYGSQVSFMTASDDFYIGQSYGGGIIFYIDQTGKHGLIAANTDQSTGATWGCFETVIETLPYIGSGMTNTITIVNSCGEGGIAAKICYDLELNGYSDWFLPSVNEFDKMYEIKDIIGGFDNKNYWTSCAYDAWFAWIWDWGLDDFFQLYKDQLNCVRAVRAF